MNDASNPQALLGQSWSDNARAWIEAVRSGSIDSRRVTNRAVVDAVLARGPQRVLDVGCGEGWLVRALAEQGVEAAGVDAVPALIDAARQAGQGTFYLYSYTELARHPKIAGEAYNVIVANFSLLDEDIAPLLCSLRSLLCAGGALIVQTLHPWTVEGGYCDGWRTEHFERVAGEWQAMPWYFRTLSSWLALLASSGYRLSALSEPRESDSSPPLSLLMIAEPQEPA